MPGMSMNLVLMDRSTQVPLYVPLSLAGLPESELGLKTITLQNSDLQNAPGRIRTCDPRLRRRIGPGIAGNPRPKPHIFTGFAEMGGSQR